MRCPHCGILLAGRRADHPVICSTLRSIAEGAPARVRLLEGSAVDPFALETEIAEGPIERGVVNAA